MYACISICHLKADHVEEVIAAAKKLQAITHSQPGNLHYDILRPEGKPDVVILSEAWQTKADFEAHVAHADEPGDPVYEFGQVVGPASAEEADLFPCQVEN
jgi:quinol monooxygenase YgiN